MSQLKEQGPNWWRHTCSLP